MREPVSYREGPPDFLAWALYGVLSWLLLGAIVLGLYEGARALGGLL